MRIQYHGHPDDKPLRSSLNDMITFKEHICWLDIVDWIDERIDYHMKQLLSAIDMEAVRSHQAAVSQLEDLKDIPDLFIEELKALKEEANKNKNK